MSRIDETDWSSFDAQDKHTLARCAHLCELLSGGIYPKMYKPPVQLTSALNLTPRGSRLANQVKGDGVDLRDAQLATFIELSLADNMLVDIKKIDLNTVEESISSELRRRRIRLPWIYGRLLYDAVADAGLNEQPYPSPEATESLLENFDFQGVFQHGPYTVGPYGLISSPDWRYIPVSRSAPALHCEEPDCQVVHALRLQSYPTGLSKAQELIREKVDKARRPSSKLYDAIDAVETERQPPYRWNNMDSLPFFLADCFSLDERKLLLAKLLDTPGGAMRVKCAEALPSETIGDAKGWLREKSESEIMQLTLLASNDKIHLALNQLIWARELEIPSGETRGAMLVAGGAGPLRVRLEASQLGVRYKVPSRYLQLRLQGLIGAIYQLDRPEDIKRLDWLLRQHEGGDGQGRLVNALAIDDPKAMIARILVADEATYRNSLEFLGLPSGRFDHEPDSILAELISWHIGYSLEDPSHELRYVTEHARDLKRLVQTLPIDALDKHQMGDVRALAGKLFPGLEAALKRTLRFTCWAMLRDHFAEGATLEYSAGAAEEFFDNWVKSSSERLERTRVAEMTLADILTCFGMLGKRLRELDTKASQFKRESSGLPRSMRDWGSPFRFAFCHTVPYLDLDTQSKAQIADAISRVSSGLQAEKVPQVRNSLLHDAENFPGVDAILTALNEIEARLGQLTSFGLYPVEYRLVGSDSDDVGRERVRLRSAENPDITLLRPSQLDLAAFPARGVRQIVVPAARIDGTAEPLRFAHRQDSTFRVRWANFPRRPKRRLTLSADGSGS